MSSTPYKYDESHYDDTSNTRHSSDGVRSPGDFSDASLDHRGTPFTSCARPTRADDVSLGGGSSCDGSPRHGRKMSAGAAHFHPGQQSHYYRDMKGEWEDDDF
jgi:hypothetical protein